MWCQATHLDQEDPTNPIVKCWCHDDLDAKSNALHDGIDQGRNLKLVETLDVQREAFLNETPFHCTLHPVLHLKLGLVNRIVNKSMTWIHMSFDQCPTNELALLRKDTLLATLEVEMAENNLEEWMESIHGGVTLEVAKSELKCIL